MKKILTTVAGLLTLAMVGAGCSAVDTKEATSTTPASVVTVTAQELKARHESYDDRVSRSAARPKSTVVYVAPGITHHDNHVNHVRLVKAAKAHALAEAKAAKAIAKKKAYKPKVKKTYEPKKVYKKKTFKKTYTKVKKTYKNVKVRVSGIANCIGKYESGNNPKAQNRTTTASGYYQFVNGTWNNYKGYKRAKDAPLSVQTEKFYQVWNGGKGAGHWVVAHKCGY